MLVGQSTGVVSLNTLNISKILELYFFFSLMLKDYKCCIFRVDVVNEYKRDILVFPENKVPLIF